MAVSKLGFDPERLRTALQPTRWKILHTLTNGPRTTGEIAERISESPQLVIYQLKPLIDAGFVAELEDAPKYCLIPQKWSLEVLENSIKTGFGGTGKPETWPERTPFEELTPHDLESLDYTQLQKYAREFDDINGRRSRGYLLDRLAEKLHRA